MLKKRIANVDIQINKFVMEYLVIDILILAFIYWLYYVGKEDAKPRNPAEDFWEHKYSEFKNRAINDLEKK